MKDVAKVFYIEFAIKNNWVRAQILSVSNELTYGQEKLCYRLLDLIDGYIF